MVAGRVVRFDGTRGYGFIAPAHGGEDVFLHVNDLLFPEASVRSGLDVEFEIEDGDRGLKASSVRMATGPDGSPLSSSAGHRSGVPASVPRHLDGDDPLCDVLTTEEYTQEVTEVLLEAAPSLTGEQILQVRRALTQLSKNHGWTEG
ncbi:DNA-binding protein [Streptomyces spiroverticillatus]|uniref:DNA-binding protein n=1 Tax=Streptomyces finlayi TaxID=67296 RepID=A0A919C8F6_9ACTN|nr:cold shock domain-containing protein [Streptomyces finlayi]GHA01366.1 DNA-binding protein [Streptomyces spiroverticillatus]GHC85786.1 DNA-binding protein [Streptomyces finlayi]